MPSPPKALALRTRTPTTRPVTAPPNRAQTDTRDQPVPSTRTPSNAATSVELARRPGALPPNAPPALRPVPPAGQNTLGNAAVAAVKLANQPAPAQQPAAPAGKPETAQEKHNRPGPNADPKFLSLKKDVQRKKRTVAASHPPPRTEAASAQGAALPPKDDAEAQGKTANAEKMNAAQPKEFDREAFIKAVEKAIADKAPKNLDEADKFAGSGKAGEIRTEVQGKVGEGKTDSAAQVAATTEAPPDTSAAVPKKVVPMAADRPPAAPGAPDAANAVPDKLPPSATDLSAGPARVNQQMADANVTETQLKKSNEPRFANALAAKKTAEHHSDVTPGKLRKNEAGQLHESTVDAKRTGAAAMNAMGAQRIRTGQQVGSGKAGAKGRDEDKRAKVTAILQGVFDTMKQDVEGILNGLDKLVDDQFGRGEKAARDAFTAEHRRKMDEYKDRRYSGILGKARWVKDLFAGLPDEANKIFDEARDHYLQRMRQVIADVATTVATELNRAKRRIAQGRTDLQNEVKKLPADLQAIGKEAAAGFADQFDELSQSVDDKGTELVDTLATKYTDALKAVDSEIAEEKEKNKGLVDKAVDAVKGVVQTILELGRLLLSVLLKAASVVPLILANPIGFLGNLVTAVGAGLRQFLRNIGTHLQQGVLAWLLGKATEAGLELPAKFDAEGVLKLLASLLGLTWQAIRARIVRRVPEPAVAAAETAVPIVAEVRKRGVAGMWNDLKGRVGDLKRDLVGKVIQYVTPTIVIAGITWVISLLNPASAFVRAVKLIIDIVKFVVTQARQIIDFVNAVLDAVIAIARGGSGGVPSLVERALARSIPVLLGFLASLLGLGGVAAKVKQIVQAMAKPVGRAIDWVIDKIVGLVKKLWAKVKAKVGRKKPKKKPTRSARPHRTPRAKKRERRKATAKRDRRRAGKKPPAREPARPSRQKQRKLDAALREAEKLLAAGKAPREIRAALPSIRARHGLTALDLVVLPQGGMWLLRVKGTINPSDTTPGHRYGFESKIHIYEHNKVSGRQILKDVRTEYAARYRSLIEPKGKKVAVVRFEAHPDDAWEWRARMDASRISAEQKEKITSALGFTPVHQVLRPTIRPAEFAAILRRHNADPSVTGLIVQLPVPDQYRDVVSLISPEKDIDAILGARSRFPVGATSEGISRVSEPFLHDKPVVAVVGARGFVGQGVVRLVSRHGVEVIQLDAGDDLNRVRDAAVIISVTGREGILTPALVLPGHRLVIDSGFVPKQEGVASDIHPDAKAIPKQITPVPFGIGPVEMAILAERLVRKEADPALPPWRLTDPEGRIRM
ncbi:tetrahydrofolate dehydrogenase/cyclohydrolase catalytic domain-containing protein [Amycolatopsis silviterrae]|uniref:Tetrahydrofolate dehydrogenase/cyclohydrolase catalytic domain-containing protein n=1 Tax=Amycolatopsis silviterrae TaxID=1656914 RepID=A0ABW5H337_9PSEU